MFLWTWKWRIFNLKLLESERLLSFWLRHTLRPKTLEKLYHMDLSELKLTGVHRGDIKCLGINRSAKQGRYQRSIWQVGKCPLHTLRGNGHREWDHSYLEKGSRSWSPNTHMDRRESRVLELKSQASNSYVNYRIFIKMWSARQI